MNDAITFWLGCNVLRHGDIIHTCVDILRAIDVDARVVGGPDYCCGTSKDANITAGAGMARRTATNLVATGRDHVVAWCPSCHVHMTDVVSKAHDTGFSLSHFAELLHERRSRLAPLLTRRIDLRLVLHEHHEFDRRVPVNAMVRALLELIPGVSVTPSEFLTPGYMCAPLAGMPAVLQHACARTLESGRAHGATALATIFHQCHREWLGLDADGHIPVWNYIHLIGRSMGIEHPDEYRAWKSAGRDAKSLVDRERLDAVGEALFDRALAPEFARRPYRPGG